MYRQSKNMKSFPSKIALWCRMERSGIFSVICHTQKVRAGQTRLTNLKRSQYPSLKKQNSKIKDHIQKLRIRGH